MSLSATPALLSSTPVPVTSSQPSAEAPGGPLCTPSALRASSLLLKKRTRRALRLPFRHRVLWKAGSLDGQNNTQVRTRELWGTNTSEGQRSWSVEIRGPGPWLDHVSARSLSLPPWPILSSPRRKKSNRSCWAPGVHALNWISQRKFHGNRNTVRRMKTGEPALNTASLFPPNGRHPRIPGHVESWLTALC